MAQTRALSGHTPSLLDLFMAQRRRATNPLSAGAGLVRPQSNPFAGRIHFIGPLGQYRPPEGLRRGAPLPGIDVLPDGHAAEVVLMASAVGAQFARLAIQVTVVLADLAGTEITLCNGDLNRHTLLERTLLDGLAMPQHCGGFGEVIHAFGEAVPRLDFERLVEYARRLGSAIAKRAGWVLERQSYATPQVEELVALPTKGHQKLDPTGSRKGVYNNRWMVQENLTVITGA